MKINWPLVFVLLWFSVLVGVIFDQYQFAALMALTTVVVTVCVLITRALEHLKRSSDWEVVASTDQSMVGLTIEDVYPEAVAEQFKAHFAQQRPGVFIMGKEPDGTWRVITHDDEDPDI